MTCIEDNREWSLNWLSRGREWETQSKASKLVSGAVAITLLVVIAVSEKKEKLDWKIFQIPIALSLVLLLHADNNGWSEAVNVSRVLLFMLCLLLQLMCAAYMCLELQVHEIKIALWDELKVDDVKNF